MSQAIKSTFFSVYNDLVESFLRYFTLNGDYGEEDIHLLRLDVKGLRSALDLAEFITRKKSGTKNIRAMISPIFSKAGEVRTAQMNLKLLRKERVPGVEVYERALLDEETRSRRELENLLMNFNRERFRRLADDAGAVITGLENARVTVYASKFIRARYDTVFRILIKVKTPRDLHEIRKNIKSVRNTIRLISARGIGRRSGIEERIVRTADQTLGTWHDDIVFCEHLRRFISKNRKSPAAQGMRRLAEGLGKKNDALFSSVVRDTRKRMNALRSALEIV